MTAFHMVLNEPPPPLFAWERPDFEVWTSTDFKVWVQRVQARVPVPVRRRDLEALWWCNDEFHVIWHQKRKLTGGQTPEVALLVIMLNRRIPGRPALAVVEFWWDTQKIPIFRRADLQEAYAEAEVLSQRYFKVRKAVTEQFRQETLKGRPRVRTMNILRSGPLRAKQIADALATDSNVQGQQPTPQHLNTVATMLRRMVTKGVLVREERGVYALPEGWTEKNPLPTPSPPGVVNESAVGVLLRDVESQA
jgi:hypothetical protein